MRRVRLALFGLLLCVVLPAGCSRRLPTPPPAETAALSGLSAPLDVQQFEVVSAEGYRGVFLKLSRLPESVSHHSEKNPARIVIEVKGPTGTETAEEQFPGQDSLVSGFRVSRQFGTLRIVLDLETNEPPDYSVHVMADWIMIRLQPADAVSSVGREDLERRRMRVGGTA